MTKTFEVLTENEVVIVAGGFSGPTSGDIVTDLLICFPSGEFVGTTFYPNGAPRPAPNFDPILA